MADSGLSGLFFGFDRLNGVAAALEQRLEAAGVENATDAGMADGLSAVQRRPDGSLAPLDLTPGFTTSQRAYNQAARNTYIARTQIQAEEMASTLMARYPLDPDAFKSAWDGYMSGTLKSEQTSRVGAALALDLMKIGNRARAGIASDKLRYDQADQKDTWSKRALMVKMQATSYAERTGSYDNDEVKDAQSEYDSLVANLLHHRHISQGQAEEMRRSWGVDVFLAHGKKLVDDAYNRGKTPLGPGSIVDATRVARDLAMRAAETLMVSPEKATEMLMGQASLSHRLKMAEVGERREALQIANEQRAAAAHARAEESRAQTIAAGRAALQFSIGRANGEAIRLFPGSDTGEDEIRGGDRGGVTLFKSMDEARRKLGDAGLAQLIDRERAWRRELERDETAARNQERANLMQAMAVGQPVSNVGPDGAMRDALLLPGGKVVATISDIATLTDDELTRFQLASQFVQKLAAPAKDRLAADDKEFQRTIADTRSGMQQVASEILAGRAAQGDLVKYRDMMRMQFADPGLTPERRERVQQLMAETEKRIGEVNKEFAERSDLRAKLNSGGARPLDDKERLRVLELAPELDITKPSANPDEALRTVRMLADHLSDVRMQVDSKTATWLAGVVQRGNIYGGQGEVDLRKAFTLLDRIEQMPDEQKTLFKAEMEKTVPGWSDIASIGRKAMEHHLSSGIEVREGNRTTVRYGTTYAQAYKDLWTGYQQAKVDGRGQGGYVSSDASSYIRNNIREVAPRIVANMGWFDWAGWQIGVAAPEIPQAMAERFAEHVRTEALLGDGQFGLGEAQRQAVARLKADGWYPSSMEAMPSVAGKPRIEWKQKPIEWQLEQRGYVYGKQALETTAAAAIAQHRGVKFDDAWKLMAEGKIALTREPGGGSRVNVVVFSETYEPSLLGPVRMSRPTWLRDKTGRPVSIDIGTETFKQFYNSFVGDIFGRARDFDLEVPAPAVRRSQDFARALGSDVETYRGGRINIPVGNLLRDRIAEPGSGTGSYRLLQRLIGVQQEQDTPNIKGGDEDDTLTGSSPQGYDPWELAAALWMKQIRRKEGGSTDLSESDVREMADFMRANANGILHTPGWPKDPEAAIEHFMKGR